MMPLTTNYFFGVKIVLLMHAPLHFQFITFNLVGNLNLNVLHNIPIMDHPFKSSAKFRDFLTPVSSFYYYP